MKILLFISQLNKGGAERVVTNLANYFVNSHEVTIAVLRNRKIEYEIDNRIRMVNLESKLDNHKNKVKKTMIRYRNYLKLLKNNTYDVILCFLPDPAFIALCAKKKTKSKIVVSVRNDPEIEYKSLTRKLLMKYLYKRADGFVFQTVDAQRYFSKEIQNKSTVIMNSIDKSFIVQPFDGIRDKEIVSVGRLEKQKNHEMLIRAFANIYNYISNYKLIIYGEGSERQRLESIINNLNLQGKIMLPGKIDDVKSSIYKSSLFVLSSNYEGMPNSLLEAMTLGIPCVSTDCPCGGPKTIIKNDVNGCLVPTNDILKLSEVMLKIIKNDDLSKKLSINSSNDMKKFYPDIINKHWEEYLEKICKKEE